MSRKLKKSREEALIELNNYILIHGTVDNITKNKIGEKIYRYFQKNKEFIEDAIEELGYELDKVKTYKTKGYYDDFNKVKILLEKFIELNNRFPIKLEIMNDLGIGQRYIDKFGGMNELKRKMNYTSNDLIDLRGDFNRSIQELQVANFLCMQGLKNKYKREQHPFPKSEGRYRSDFMFDLDDNKKLHIEVWGYDTNTNSSICEEYNKKRKIKEQLYEKYKDSIILVSTEQNIFNNKYENIEKELYNIFSKYLNLKYKDIDYRLLIPPTKLTDEELLDGVLKLSKDKNYLPSTKNIHDNGMSGLHIEILKRYDSYLNFANKFNKKLLFTEYKWNKELIFSFFKQITYNNKLIDKDNLNIICKNSYSNLSKYGGIIKLKLEFLSNYLIINNTIPDIEVNWLIELSNGIIKTNSNYEESDFYDAQQLIKQLNSNNLIIKSCSICGKTIEVNSIDIIMCDNCKGLFNDSNISYSLINKSKHTELEYDNNFNIVTDKPFKLTTKGFNEYSNIKIKSYIKYFNLHNWLNVIKYYNKFNDLYNYIKEEYLNFYNLTKSKNLSKFCRQHNYIVHELLLEIGTEKIMNDCGFSKQKQFSKDDLKNNFINIVKSIGYIPKYTEFANLTNIHIGIYVKYFNLKGKVYDNVVKLYSTEVEFYKLLISTQIHNFITISDLTNPYKLRVYIFAKFHKKQKRR